MLTTCCPQMLSSNIYVLTTLYECQSISVNLFLMHDPIVIQLEIIITSVPRMSFSIVNGSKPFQTALIIFLVIFYKGFVVVKYLDVYALPMLIFFINCSVEY